MPKVNQDEEIDVSHLEGRTIDGLALDAPGSGNGGTHVTTTSEEVTAALGTIRYLITYQAQPAYYA